MQIFKEKIANFKLKNMDGNKYTLIVNLDDSDCVYYKLYSGWGNSGMPHSIKSLQAKELPFELKDNEKKHQLKERVIDAINKGVMRFVK